MYSVKTEVFESATSWMNSSGTSTLSGLSSLPVVERGDGASAEWFILVAGWRTFKSYSDMRRCQWERVLSRRHSLVTPHMHFAELGLEAVDLQVIDL